MNETFFKTAFVILWIVYIAIRVPHDRKYKQVEKLQKAMPKGEKILLTVLGLGLLLIPLIWACTNFLAGFSLALPYWIRGAAILISLISLIYFWKIHKTLATNWSPTLEIRKGHELITTGIYKSIRHPMYTQIWVWVIAQGLIVSNLIASLSGILAWAIVYFIRVPNEEKMMIGHFGNKYIEYMNRSGRIFPTTIGKKKYRDNASDRN